MPVVKGNIYFPTKLPEAIIPILVAWRRIQATVILWPNGHNPGVLKAVPQSLLWT